MDFADTMLGKGCYAKITRKSGRVFREGMENGGPLQIHEEELKCLFTALKKQKANDELVMNYRNCNWT